MKPKTIPMQKEMNARKLLVAILCLLLFNCGGKKEMISQNQADLYKIIEKGDYEQDGLFYRTLSYDKLPSTHMFSYNRINKENVKYNSITEQGRFVNFDTIFNEEQRQDIDYHLKNLKSVKLKESHLRNPKILSRDRSPYGTPMAKQKGHSSISFPFIVNDKSGKPYGFIYRNDGLLYIYKKEENRWKEFARLEVNSVSY